MLPFLQITLATCYTQCRAWLGWAGLEKVRLHLICCVEDDERYTFCGVVFV